MFVEPHLRHKLKRGCIEVVCGAMFSGKTEELIRRLKRAKIAKQQVAIFKPALDTRYDESAIVSHDSNSLQSIPVDCAQSILLYASDVDVVGIDEAQFFDHDIVEVCQHLASKGVRVIVAGLDMDYLGKPFGAMPSLLAVAEHVTKVHAICMVCNELASHSFRLSHSQETILLGEKESYEPRCRTCFEQGMNT